MTKSTFSDLSQLVGNPSARGPSLLKTISQDGVAYPTDTGRTCWAGRSRQSEQRGPRTWNETGPSDPHRQNHGRAWTERSLSAADTTQLCSLSPPHTLHFTVLHHFEPLELFLWTLNFKIAIKLNKQTKKRKRKKNAFKALIRMWTGHSSQNSQSSKSVACFATSCITLTFH